MQQLVALNKTRPLKTIDRTTEVLPLRTRERKKPVDISGKEAKYHENKIDKYGVYGGRRTESTIDGL